MAYEQIAGESFKPQGMKEVITLFYSMVMTADNELTITFDEFIDWLDENPEQLNNFSTFLVDNTKRVEALSPKDNKEEVKGDNEKN